MVLKNIYQRSCSAVQSRAAGENSKDSSTVSLSNLPSIRQSVTSVDFLHDILCKKIPDQDFKPSTSHKIQESNMQNKVFLLNGEGSFLSSCTTFDDDLTSYVIQKLEYKLQKLKLELSKEKNAHQLLKKDVFVAKKVLKKEIAVNTQDFETFLEKANSKPWKGKQENICVLKRQLRYLNKIIDPLNEGTDSVLFRKKSNPKTQEFTKITTYDDKVCQCVELERREMRKNAERYRQDFVVSRELMEKNLERLTNKSERLEEEVRVIREKLSTSQKEIDEELFARFHETQNEIKAKFKEKDEEIQAVDILEQEFSRNGIIKANIKAALTTSRQALKEKEDKVISLKDEITKLQAIFENTKEEKDKEEKVKKNKLEDANNEYGKIVIKSENLFVQVTDNKRRLEEIRKLQLQKSSISIMRNSLKIRTEQLTNQNEKTNGSKLTMEITDNRANLHKTILLKYQSCFYVLEVRNENKLRKVADLIERTKEWTFGLIESRRLMWEKTSDIMTLEKQNKKLKKSVLYSTKQKFVKKQNSSLHMMVILNETKIYLAIMRKENQYLKSLIRYILAIKDDDCNVLQSLLMRNKDFFLKESNCI